MVSLFSAPDQSILRESVSTLIACTYRAQAGIAVIPVTDIMSVVAMVPLPLTEEEEASAQRYAQRFFVVEKPGLVVANMAGRVESMAEAEDDVDFEPNA